MTAVSAIIRAMPEDRSVNPEYVRELVGGFDIWVHKEEDRGGVVVFDGDDKASAIMPIRI